MYNIPNPVLVAPRVEPNPVPPRVEPPKLVPNPVPNPLNPVVTVVAADFPKPPNPANPKKY